MEYAQRIIDTVRRIFPDNIKKQAILILFLGLWIKTYFSRIAMDGAKWITIHPRGKKKDGSDGEKGKGVPVLIDDESGRILGGMGGKFNYQKVNKIGKEKHVPHFIKKRLAEYNGEFEEPKVQPKAGSVGTSTGLNKQQKEAQEKVNKAQKAVEEAQTELDKLRADNPNGVLFGEEMGHQIESILPEGYSIKLGQNIFGYNVYSIYDENHKDICIVSAISNYNANNGFEANEKIKKISKKIADANWIIKSRYENEMTKKIASIELAYLKNAKKQLKNYAESINEAEVALKTAQDNYKYAQTEQRRAGLTFDSVNASSSIATKIPQDTKTVYDEAIRKNAPIHLQQFIADRIGQVQVNDIHCSVHRMGFEAWFDSQNGVNFNIDKPRNVSSFFHETGHAMDYNQNTKTFLSDTWHDGKFKKSLKEDLDKLIKERQNDFNTLSTQEYYDKYGVFAYRSMLFEEVIKQECRNLQCDDETKLAIADMIKMSSRGKYGYGHSTTYAKDIHSITTEAFAELTEIYCLRPHEIEVVKKYFPTAVADYNEMIKEA